MNREIIKKRIHQVAGLFRGYFPKKRYITYWKNSPIRQNCILLESQQGKMLFGNIYYILEELTRNPEYKKYELYVSAIPKKVSYFKKILKDNQMERVKVIPIFTYSYFKILATAKFLINDNTFCPNFIKKENQIYLNTWHGTPLKTLGRKMEEEFYAIGNTQKNFLTADYLLYPNEFTMEHMLEDYMINNIGNAAVLLNGYPRNTAFFQTEKQSILKKKLRLEKKQIFAYLPTWRGTMANIQSEKQIAKRYIHLKQLDQELTDNQVLYVNLHPVEKEQMDFSKFSRVFPFPKEYETYQFLSIADVLITDYSSVLFDFALTRKKIILFCYDRKEYKKERGFYLKLEDLPFPRVETIVQLVEELNCPKEYKDEEFLNQYCPYDKPSSTKEICELVILQKQNKVKQLQIPKNKKENVLIYAGDWKLSGITTSICNLLQNIDRTKRNYYILYKIDSVRTHYENLRRIPEEVNYLGYFFTRSISVWQTIQLLLFLKRGIGSKKRALHILDEMEELERKRVTGTCKFDMVIQFSGYEADAIMLFTKYPARKVIYVHNDMEQEVSCRKNQKYEVIQSAYNNYDKVAIVTEDLRDSTARIKGNGKNIVLAKNVIQYQHVLELAKKPLVYDKQTKADIAKEHLEKILKNKAIKKFITIGRFSKEKGHIRLLQAFEKLYESNPAIHLIIIGGHGPLYEETKAFKNKLKSKNHISLICFLSNPYTVLKQCDYFILSSFYEGFGLVLAEADILGIPCISTDIVGPRLFMQQYGGKLVEDSTKGIYKGMKACLSRKVTKTLQIDYEQYNKEALAQFESFFEKREEEEN